MKNRFSKLIEKDGFYIILFMCVCVIGITSVVVSKGNIAKKREDKLSKTEDLIILGEGEKVNTSKTTRMGKDSFLCDESKLMEAKRKTYEAKEAWKEEVEEEEKNIEQEDEIEKDHEEEGELEFVEEEQKEVSPVEESPDMIMPVEGKLGLDFAKDSLVYSETLEEWTSHMGMDILAKEGSKVKAVLSGKVLEVYDDWLWGKVILIDHGNGLLTKYANLSTLEIVKKGIQINKGDVISEVGKTADIEMLMDPHIHFEVIKDGINIDPKDFLSIGKD